jgi:hypothetical protein
MNLSAFSSQALQKIVTCIFLTVIFISIANNVNSVVESNNWVIITHNFGYLVSIAALMIAGVFFKGQNNKQNTLVFAFIMAGYTPVYFFVADYIHSPYIGIWLDTILDFIVLAYLLYKLPVELYIAKTLGQKGIFPGYMMRVIKNAGTTNYYLVIVFFWITLTMLDLVFLSMGLSIYGIINNIPWDGSFMTHMEANEYYILVADTKLYFYDFKDLAADMIGFLMAIVTIMHVMRDNHKPDEIGFNGKTLPIIGR